MKIPFSKIREIKIPATMIYTGLIASYLSFLMLFLRRTKISFFSTFLFFILGIVLCIWKRPDRQADRIQIFAVFYSVVIELFCGSAFYKHWLYSPGVYDLAIIFDTSVRGITLVLSGAFCILALFFLSGFVQETLQYAERFRKKFPYLQNILMILILSVFCVVYAQKMQDLPALSMGVGKFLWGVGIVFATILTLYTVSNSIVFAMICGSANFMILSFINVYVYSFRQRLFNPVDIFSFSTAINVRGSYSLFPIPNGILLALVLWSALLLLFCKLASNEKYRASAKLRIGAALLSVVGIFSIAVYANNLNGSHWYNDGAKENGYILDFTSKIKEIKIAKPNGYKLQNINDLANQFSADSENKSSQNTPHIIVIMDEAFSDLGVVGNVSTNREVTPFISALKENTVRGYALVSVHGGNTASSEFEFLTSNSMAWLAPNSVPYQQYVKSTSYALPSILKTNFGYKSIAMHPYDASGWNRPEVYEHFGFDETYFIEDFPNRDLVRCYVSDREMFDEMIEKYEENRENPLFLFGVTMQNHGGYLLDGGYDHSITLSGYKKAYPDVEQYLSLLLETDRAVERLISYFEKVDDEVLILFYGDHQPAIDVDFYKEIRKDGFKSLNDLQTKYRVPFFLWTNYDIEEKEIELTSVNYLSTYVYENAGLPLPPYNRFLKEMEQVVPAINAYGFYSKETNSFLPLSKGNKEEKMWLKYYKHLQYNNLFDPKNRNESMFPTSNP